MQLHTSPYKQTCRPVCCNGGFCQQCCSGFRWPQFHIWVRKLIVFTGIPLFTQKCPFQGSHFDSLYFTCTSHWYKVRALTFHPVPYPPVGNNSPSLDRILWFRYTSIIPFGLYCSLCVVDYSYVFSVDCSWRQVLTTLERLHSVFTRDSPAKDLTWDAVSNITKLCRHATKLNRVGADWLKILKTQMKPVQPSAEHEALSSVPWYYTRREIHMLNSSSAARSKSFGLFIVLSPGPLQRRSIQENNRPIRWPRAKLPKAMLKRNRWPAIKALSPTTTAKTQLLPSPEKWEYGRPRRPAWNSKGNRGIAGRPEKDIWQSSPPHPPYCWGLNLFQLKNKLSVCVKLKETSWEKQPPSSKLSTDQAITTRIVTSRRDSGQHTWRKAILASWKLCSRHNKIRDCLRQVQHTLHFFTQLIPLLWQQQQQVDGVSYVPGATPNLAMTLTRVNAWTALVKTWLCSIDEWLGMAYSFTLMMEAAEYSKTSTYFHQTTWCHIPDYRKLNLTLMYYKQVWSPLVRSSDETPCMTPLLRMILKIRVCEFEFTSF